MLNYRVFKGNVVMAGILFVMSKCCFHIVVLGMPDVQHGSLLHFGNTLPPEARRTEEYKPPGWDG